ncbi:YsnF/AvaK domain-containing protein [Dictyobacter aurantiacus]|uniref:DUF2382 domain-containing protein n=1 Tax=Dictyobacter aurantiacus TaxID=1936993 RepID=A0A401ZKF8_9CHLR|nr:YsnF/AvaK domain-containing protein [Dictyobacter aurantiacus]GCE07357.1 hypothetical protein KDAU_46860 [Dictyobacter aurantiacus]
MAMTRPNLMCVFDEPAQADDAINALENAGFGADQIYYSSRPNTDNGFFASLRNLFTDNGDTNVSRDLKDLGLTNDEADYYQQQHRAGHGIVAVQANGREQEVLSILRSYGGQIYGTQNASGQAGTSNTTTTRTDSDYDTTGGTRAGTYQSDRAYSNADAGTSTYQDQQAYNNAGTGAGTYQNNSDYNNTNTYQNDQNYATTDRGANMYQNDRDANTYGNDRVENDVNDEEQRRLRLREERLNVGKERVQSGEVGLHKDVVSEEKNIDVPVSHEEVYVERRPVADGEVDNDTPLGTDENIRVPVSEEQVNTSKDTVTTGEVGIGKRNVQENRRVHDTVRREEARVDTDGDVPVEDRTRDQNL